MQLSLIAGPGPALQGSRRVHAAPAAQGTVRFEDTGRVYRWPAHPASNRGGFSHGGHRKSMANYKQTGSLSVAMGMNQRACRMQWVRS